MKSKIILVQGQKDINKSFSKLLYWFFKTLACM